MKNEHVNLGIEGQPRGRQKSVAVENADAIGPKEGEETAVAAQVILPSESSWAWVVLAASFFCLLVIDGCSLSYGALLPDIVKSLDIDRSIGALINAIESTMYFACSPFWSGFINRFGFRTSCMTGSIISSTCLLAAYFCTKPASLMLFLALTGAGLSLASLAATLIVGFYFEKRRALAIAISSGGGSVGVMVLYPLSNILVNKNGWENAMLVHAGLHGMIFFMGLTFRPLLSLTITQTENEGNPTRTVTYLPTVSNQPGKDGAKQATASTTEKLLHACSSKRFPTASAFFPEITDTQPKSTETTSTKRTSAAVSKITLQAQGTVNKSQMKQVQSMISKMQMQDGKTNTGITIQVNEEVPKSFWQRLFHWQPDTGESRPMYRDDAFYSGNVEKLPVYRKSVATIKEEDRTGLEYQLAVTRAIRADDLKQRHGLCTIALRRVLASMLDITLLKKKSMKVVCFSGTLTYIGVFVPFVFLQDRNAEAGVDKFHCSLFVSSLSFSSILGRFVFCLLTNYIDVCRIIMFGLVVAGISSIVSTLSYTVFSQYTYSVVYGACISAYFGCRSIILVQLYGLENLTNATGLLLLFLGLGNLIGTPLAGTLKTHFGYNYAFYASGSFLILSGLILIPVNYLVAKERKELEKAKPKNTIS